MYSSTTLEGPMKSGCWRQLDFAESGQESLFPLMYRSHLGIAAHATLQYCVERGDDDEAAIRKTAEEVGDLLIKQGRTFRGREEPPLPADDVWAGVEVAVSYLLGRGLPADPKTEGISVEHDVEHPSIPYRALIDLQRMFWDGDEESQFYKYKVTDYKTGWQDQENALDSLQRWGQAVVAWRNAPPEVDVITQSVINLRTWTEYTRDLWLNNPEDVAELEKWERRINSLCLTAEHNKSPVTGKRPAAPGAGCLSCPWRHVCDEGMQFHNLDKMDQRGLAVELAKVEGWRDLVILALKATDPEQPIPIDGGFAGYQEKSTRILAEGREGDLLDEWAQRTGLEVSAEDRPALVSLLAALKPGKGNLDAMAKALMPERRKGIGQERDDWVKSVTVERRYAQFGVWKEEAS